MKRYLVIFTVLVLVIVAILVFPKKTSDPVASSPVVSQPTVEVPAPPKVEPIPEPVKPADPPKVEPVVSGPQPGDPVLLVPHELWRYATKTLDGGVGFSFPADVKEVTLTLPTDVYVTAWLGLIQFPAKDGGDKKETFEMISLSPSKSMESAPVRMSIIMTERVRGRINYPVLSGQPIITIHPGDRRAFYRGNGYDLLIGRSADDGGLPDLPDEVKREADPYHHFKKVFEWWVKEYRK